MANYRYHVITPAGKEKKGIITASDRPHAMAVLKNDGNTVISIDAPSIWDKEFELPFLNPGVRPRDMSVFCRQFVTLTESGISIVRAMEMLEEQTVNKLLKEAIRETRASVEKGDTLAGSMRHHEKVFPPMFVNLVQAGEEAGKLSLSFERMAAHYEKTAKLQNIIKKAMIYPIILSIVAVIVIIVMLVYIVPMYSDMFVDMDAELPAITRAVVGLSNFMTRYWYIILIGIFAIVMGLRAYGSTESGDYVYSNLVLRIPLVGKLKKKTACAQFSRNLSTLLSAGVPIIEALEITANTMDNTVYRLAISDAREQVARGIQLSVPLQESGVFPSMVYHMVGIGEETGGLDTMLDKVAEYYEEEVPAATEQAAAALDPLVIIFMAVIVIAIIAAVFTPMLTLYSSVDNL